MMDYFALLTRLQLILSCGKDKHRYEHPDVLIMTARKRPPKLGGLLFNSNKN